MAELVTDWAVDFRDLHPEVTVELQASGSAAAPTALAEGTANLGAMSRLMSQAELQQFLLRRGFMPTAIPVGQDALALIVHPDNPVDVLSLEQIDALFSETRLCGGRALPRDWRGVIDVSGQGEQLPVDFARQIEPFSRTAISGSYGLFKREALCNGDYAAHVVELPGFAAIVDAVSQSKGAIAYAGLGFVDQRVKVVDLQLADGERVGPIAASEIARRRYPLRRTLYFYLAIPPGQSASALECRFLRYTTSMSAAAILNINGFQPADALEAQIAFDAPIESGSVTIDDVCSE